MRRSYSIVTVLKKATFALAVGLFATTATAPAKAIGLIDLPDLQSVTVFESSGIVSAFTFNANGPELTTRLDDPLVAGNRDFIGTTFGADENYDVFYSNAAGEFDAAGAFVTITAIYAFAGDSGLNINAVRLNFTGDEELADVVTSSFGTGAFFFSNTIGNAVDGDIDTTTLMGDTANSAQRLSLTVGFASTRSGVVPVPPALPLAATGFALLAFLARRRG